MRPSPAIAADEPPRPSSALPSPARSPFPARLWPCGIRVCRQAAMTGRARLRRGHTNHGWSRAPARPRWPPARPSSPLLPLRRDHLLVQRWPTSLLAPTLHAPRPEFPSRPPSCSVLVGPTCRRYVPRLPLPRPRRPRLPWPAVLVVVTPAVVVPACGCACQGHVGRCHAGATVHHGRRRRPRVFSRH